MRTTRPPEDQDAAAAAQQEPPRGAAAARRSGAASAPAAPARGWEIEGRARRIPVGAGLHALIIGKTAALRERLAGVPLPLTQVAPAMGEGTTVAIVSNSGGEGGWLGTGGGAVILKATGGGHVFVTTYGITDDAALPEVKIVNVDQLAAMQVPAAAPQAAPAPAPVEGREVRRELVLHIERQGDRLFSAPGWAGNPGERLRVEGFAVRPLETVAPGQIEYMAFGPGGRQTPWVTDAKLCGTRGRGVPLTGFAIRLAPALRDRFDVVYEGYFFDSGVRGPQRNGEPCLPAVGDDPLGAIRLRVVERPGA